MYKVLLVDPNILSREKTQHMIDWSRSGFALEGCADTPEDAMALFDKHRFSLILISMNGLQTGWMRLCDRIRQQSRIPIILIGGRNDFQLARKAMNYQVSDYLADPVQPDDLTTSLKNIKFELDSTLLFEKKALSLTDAGKQTHSSDNVIDKVKEYVDEALNQNITLKEISSILHFNCSYLSQKFKYHENMTFNEYLLQQRMEKAKALLEKTNLKVYEIAHEIGYTEMDWFYKKFKEYTGVSANEYRKLISITA